MTPTVYLFIAGLVFGTGLLVVGIFLGMWLTKKPSIPIPDEAPDQRQFLLFLSNLSRWTNELSGDVSKYHSKLNLLSNSVSEGKQSVNGENLPGLIAEFMSANQSLQSRLDNAEERLENQTKEIAAYLTEARTDGLTGLANRRAFDQKLDERFRIHAETREAFSLALVDIDFFKKINDNYGHPAGDSVLREMSNRLQQNLPEAEQIARFGGEEFAIMLKGELSTAAELVERLRKSIIADEIKTEDSSLRVTVSCGVASVEMGERIGKLVRRADEALYAAKLGGRNRVYKHDGKLCHLVGRPSDAVPAKPVGLSNESSSANTKDDPLDALRKQLVDRLDRIVSEESKRQKA